MSQVVAGLLGVAFFVFLLVFRVPIAVAMGAAGFVGLSYLGTPEAALRVVAKDLYSTFSSYSLSVVPMFCWMGFLAYYSGIGSKLYNFAYKLLGRYPGGLVMASEAACAAFGAVCGSNTATAATIGSIAIPEMRKYKYDVSLATASVAAGGALGVLIPPSVVFVVYGIATEQSIGKLFIAGVLPGVLLTFLYSAAAYILCIRNPSLGPPGPRANLREVLSSMRGGLFEVLVVFILSMGGLFAGWFTPTEAGAVGAAGVLAVSALGRKLKWAGLVKSLRDTTRTTAMIMLLVAGATIFGRFIAVSRLTFELANWTGSLPLPPYAVMAVVILIYLILGCFIDALALVLLTVPIFYPVVVNVLGYDPIWFGVIMVLVAAMGVITPPVGINVYIVKGIVNDVPLETIFRGIWPFLIAIFVCCALLIAFPQIATFLPRFVSY